MRKFNVGDNVYVVIGSYHIENGSVIYKRNVEKFIITGYKQSKYEIKNDNSLCYLPERKLNATYEEARTGLQDIVLPA